MRRYLGRWQAWAVLAMCVNIVGCRCCALSYPYHQVVDTFTDYQVVKMDRVYCPKLDPSRGGKPDWCTACWCRICPRCCSMGTWDRYDRDDLYPPQYPFEFPGRAIEEGQSRAREEMLRNAPAPASTPTPTVKPYDR